MRRAILMARVSTDDQAENGYSLPSQLEACRKYAQEHNFVVVAEITDDCSGSIPVVDRPGGARVYDMLRKSQADVVIQYTIDRTARDKREYPIEFLLFLRDVQDLGAELHFVDTGKSDGGILDLFRAWQAAEERRKIRERTVRGRDAKAKGGLVVSSKVTPFGYDFNEGHITPNEQAPIVRDIFRWYVHGDDRGEKLSINGIATKLSKARVVTPGELKGGGKRKRASGIWNTATIYEILSNRTYCGTWEWKDRIQVSVPAIIGIDLWQAAQERKAHNKRMAKRNVRRKYLLRGRVRCGCCGFLMAGVCKNGRKRYRCSAHNIKRFEPGANSRNVRHIPCDVLDPIVWGYVLDIATNEETFHDLLVKAQKAELDALKPKRERLTMVEGLIAQAETDAAKFALALVNAQGVVGEMLQKQVDDVNERHAALCSERDTLKAEIEAGALTDEQIATMLAMFKKDVITGLQNATFEDKRRALEDLQVQVLIEGEHARVTCRIPTPDRSIALTTSK
jgi:site-specific DNA recombinase